MVRFVFIVAFEGHIALHATDRKNMAIQDMYFFFFFSFISLIADGPHHYHPACGHKGSSHLSPVHALQSEVLNRTYILRIK